jgi:uncharacterized protein (TIGR03435 family)
MELRDQLGLKVVPPKEPVEFLVIGHADKASENQPARRDTSERPYP